MIRRVVAAAMVLGLFWFWAVVINNSTVRETFTDSVDTVRHAVGWTQDVWDESKQERADR
jgi:hypothetical protein